MPILEANGQPMNVMNHRFYLPAEAISTPILISAPSKGMDTSTAPLEFKLIAVNKFVITVLS